MMKLKENLSVEKMLSCPAKPFQSRKDDKKCYNSKSKSSNKKENIKMNWNDAWQIKVENFQEQTFFHYFPNLSSNFSLEIKNVKM